MTWYPGEGLLLGQHPDTGEDIRVKKGPYGAYLQMGAAGDGQKPRRASLSQRTLDDPGFSLETAVDLLRWPKASLLPLYIADGHRTAHRLIASTV